MAPQRRRKKTGSRTRHGTLAEKILTMSTWILLRGLTREGRHWGAFPERLRVEVDSEGDANNIALLDLPGNGRENALGAPLNVADMVNFVRSRAADAGLAPPYRLVAMSL